MTPRSVAAVVVLGCAGLAAVYLSALAAMALGAHPSRSDVIVVLGNDVAPDGRPSRRLRARLDRALRLYRAGYAPRVLVSGGIEPDGRDEAAVMAAYLLAQGVPRGAVNQDPRGRDTFETARDTALRFGASRRVLMVTQGLHLPRSLLAMRRFGNTRLSGAWPRFAEPRDIYSFVREAVALRYYVIRPLGGGARPQPAHRRQVDCRA